MKERDFSVEYFRQRNTGVDRSQLNTYWNNDFAADFEQQWSPSWTWNYIELFSHWDIHIEHNQPLIQTNIGLSSVPELQVDQDMRNCTAYVK